MGLLGKFRLRLAQGHQKQLAGHILVAALHGFFFAGLQKADHIAPYLHLVLTLHLGQFVCGCVGHGQQRRHIHPRPLKQSLGSVLLAQHRAQHMGWFDVGMVLGERRALRFTQCFLELGR